MLDTCDIKKCQEAAHQIRKDIVDMTYGLKNVGAHIGGSLSLAEILSVLYLKVVNYNTSDSSDESRDRVILSKGHAALALYPALAVAGIINHDSLNEFKQNGSKLTAHPSLHGLSGIEFASGSLGQGLSLGVGVAIALKRKENIKSKVYVILGDGECDEGSVWEAAAAASNFELNNLIAIVDINKLQYDGNTEEVMKMNPLLEKWKSFGWNVRKVDGHQVEAIYDALCEQSDRPLVILADTIKGKGISYMENEKSFHNSRITKEQYEIALKELEAPYD